MKHIAIALIILLGFGAQVFAATVLFVPQGGTGGTAFGPYPLVGGFGDGGAALTASSSPSVVRIIGTSTTEASSFVRLGIGTTTPHIGVGAAIGTTTMMSGAQFYQHIASSTGATTYTVNWESGNIQRFILTANSNMVINSTSSNPRSGGKYMVEVCQDPTGSRTLTFTNPISLRWTSGTTTITSTANFCTWIGMVYDERWGLYHVLASSTSLKNQ